MTGQGRPSTVKNNSLGIPEVFRMVKYEKLTAVVPVKLWPSLAQYVKQHGASQLLRTALVYYLENSQET